MEMPLHDCLTWVMTWPKSQIRLRAGDLEGQRLPRGGTSIRRPVPVRPSKPKPAAAARKEPAAVATREEPVVVATRREEPVVAATTQKVPAVIATREEPVLVANTARHQKLLGIRPVPRRPSKAKAVAPQPPASQPLPAKDVDMAPLDQHDDDDHVDDINAYINTGACSNDMYMPPPMDDEEAFRSHVDQPRNPKTVTQRLVFTGFSQEDTPPEAGDPPQQKPSTIFSPNTLNKTVNEVGVAPPGPSEKKKKSRKRSAKKGPGASMSQPTQKIRHDDVIPGRPDGLTRVHEAGQPILSADLLRFASGAMHSLHTTILYLEGNLLKEKDPSYPVFTVNVPEDPDFVHEDPADLFFIAFEDVFNLFHLRRLNYNMVRLYAINLQLKIKRELPPQVAVADPYYMRDSQLVEGSTTRTQAVEYLASFMLRYEGKNTILLPVFPE